jgi:hypothetical protein
MVSMSSSKSASRNNSRDAEDGMNVYIFGIFCIRALLAASAAKFNIAPVRWQHPSHVAIVPTESKGKTEGNDWVTACGNFKT